MKLVDVLTPDQRHKNMSKIKGSNTKPELFLRKALWAEGYRYRLKNKLPGKPDIIFPGYRIAVFVDGCFWHRCPKHFKMPATNTKFWSDKISSNVQRDKKINSQLMGMGWEVIRVWEHEITAELPSVVKKVAALLIGKQNFDC